MKTKEERKAEAWEEHQKAEAQIWKEYRKAWAEYLNKCKEIDEDEN